MCLHTNPQILNMSVLRKLTFRPVSAKGIPVNRSTAQKARKYKPLYYFLAKFIFTMVTIQTPKQVRLCALTKMHKHTLFEVDDFSKFRN